MKLEALRKTRDKRRLAYQIQYACENKRTGAIGRLIYTYDCWGDLAWPHPGTTIKLSEEWECKGGVVGDNEVYAPITSGAAKHPGVLVDVRSLESRMMGCCPIELSGDIIEAGGD